MKRQQGFTLIELVIVLIILGILAAIAIPRFANLQREARIAVVETFYMGLRTGQHIVFAKLAANGLHSDAVTCVNLDSGLTGSATAGRPDPITNCGTDDGLVNTVFGFPAGDATLVNLFDELSPRWAVNGATAELDGIPNCGVTYTAPTAAGERPTIVKVITDC